MQQVQLLICGLIVNISNKFCFYFGCCGIMYCKSLIVCREACSHNLRARIKGVFFSFLGILLPFVLLINFLASSSARGTLDGLIGKEASEKLHNYTVSIGKSVPQALVVFEISFDLMTRCPLLCGVSLSLSR